MKDLQRMGGIAALYAAVAYVLGLIYFGLVLDYAGADDPMKKVALLVDHETGLYIVTLLLYVFFGVALVVLALALADRFRTGAPAVVRAATAFGLIWAGLLMASGMVHNVGLGEVVDRYDDDPAQAASAWLAIESVSNGLGGQFEILGGIWVLVVSWAALQARGLSRVAIVLGVLTGSAGLLTVVPALIDVAVGVFALGQIAWFVWLGVVMLRGSAEVATPRPAASVSLPSATV